MRIWKILLSIVIFAIFTFIFARLKYPSYIENWKPSTEASTFEQYWLAYCIGLAAILFVFNFIKWCILGNKK